MTHIRIPRWIGTAVHGGRLELSDDAITQGFAILAKRGKGKTVLAADMEEFFLARGESIVVLDPPAAHWGIRFATDDSGRPSGPSGFDVLIIGGEHGDIPIEQTDGREAARIIVDGHISTIVDMKALGFTARQKWCADFADEIFRINKTPRHIFFEEAQNFLPQVLKFDEQKAVLYAMSRIIEEGRSSGLGFTIISQRPAKINKDALTQIDNLFVLGMMGPQDIDQVEDWFKHHFADKDALKVMIDTLPHLKPGEAWGLMPDKLGAPVKFTARMRATYHAGRTPKPGESPVNVAKFSVTEAVKKLKTLFASKQTERRQEVSDLKQAKARIRELEAEVRKANVHHNVHPTPAMSTKVDTKAIEREVKKASAFYEVQLKKAIHTLEAAVRYAKLATGFSIPTIESYHVSVAASHNAPAVPVPRSAPLPRKPASERSEARESPSIENGAINSSQKRILKALAELEAIGREQPTRETVGFWSVLKPNTGTFRNYIGSLKTAGLIFYPTPGTIQLTHSGRELAGSSEAPTQEEVLGRARQLLNSSQQRILDALFEHPEGLSREELGERVGLQPDTGTFRNYIGAMRTAGLITYPSSGDVKAAEWLFL
jgi:hypothetical protein